MLSGGKCDDGEDCDSILDELENIDDELDETGIIFVTTEDLNFAKKTGIKNFPALVFFRNKDPLTYKGTPFLNTGLIKHFVWTLTEIKDVILPILFNRRPRRWRWSVSLDYWWGYLGDSGAHWGSECSYVGQHLRGKWSRSCILLWVYILNDFLYVSIRRFSSMRLNLNCHFHR